MNGKLLLPLVKFPAGEWVRSSACADADTDVFYIGRGESAAPAKSICAGCPVRIECLDYALANRETFGIWGGTAERERRTMRRGRRVAA